MEHKPIILTIIGVVVLLWVFTKLCRGDTKPVDCGCGKPSDEKVKMMMLRERMAAGPVSPFNDEDNPGHRSLNTHHDHPAAASSSGGLMTMNTAYVKQDLPADFIFSRQSSNMIGSMPTQYQNYNWVSAPIWSP